MASCINPDVILSSNSNKLLRSEPLLICRKCVLCVVCCVLYGDLCCDGETVTSSGKLWWLESLFLEVLLGVAGRAFPELWGKLRAWVGHAAASARDSDSAMSDDLWSRLRVLVSDHNHTLCGIHVLFCSRRGVVSSGLG